jgi:hypothetical protein
VQALVPMSPSATTRTATAAAKRELSYSNPVSEFDASDGIRSDLGGFGEGGMIEAFEWHQTAAQVCGHVPLCTPRGDGVPQGP